MVRRRLPKFAPVPSGQEFNHDGMKKASGLRSLGEILRDKGTIFKRRLARGVSYEEIAISNGITVKQVKNLIDLTGAPEPIKEMIAEGKVSATLALHEFQTKGPTAAVESLKQDIADAAEQGKDKVTAGTQAKAAAKRAPASKVSFLDTVLAEEGIKVAPSPEPAPPAGPIIRNGYVLPKTSAETFRKYWEVLCEATNMDDLALVKSMIKDTLKKAA